MSVCRAKFHAPTAPVGNCRCTTGHGTGPDQSSGFVVTAAFFDTMGRYLPSAISDNELLVVAVAHSKAAIPVSARHRQPCAHHGHLWAVVDFPKADKASLGPFDRHGEGRLSPRRRMNASGGRHTTGSRTERGAGVALAASWRPHSKRGHSEASFPGPRMAALTPLMPTATSETSSPKHRPTTKDPIISPEEAADPLKPLTLLVVLEPHGMQIRRSGCSRRPAHSWRR